MRLLTVAVVVCRAELVLLLAPLALLFLANRQLSFAQLLLAGIPTSLAALAVSVLVDSLFWRRWLYPEGEVLFFNTVLNKSHEYGTAPFHWCARARRTDRAAAPTGPALARRRAHAHQ